MFGNTAMIQEKHIIAQISDGSQVMGNENISESQFFLQIMEKKGYILRVSVPTDARLKKILLTEKGEKLYYKVRDHIHETETFLVKGMTEEEVEQLLFLLGKIKNNLTT